MVDVGPPPVQLARTVGDGSAPLDQPDSAANLFAVVDVDVVDEVSGTVVVVDAVVVVVDEVSGTDVEVVDVDVVDEVSGTDVEVVDVDVVDEVSGTDVDVVDDVFSMDNSSTTSTSTTASTSTATTPPDQPGRWPWRWNFRKGCKAYIRTSTIPEPQT